LRSLIRSFASASSFSFSPSARAACASHLPASNRCAENVQVAIFATDRSRTDPVRNVCCFRHAPPAVPGVEPGRPPECMDLPGRSPCPADRGTHTSNLLGRRVSAVVRMLGIDQHPLVRLAECWVAQIGRCAHPDASKERRPADLVNGKNPGGSNRTRGRPTVKKGGSVKGKANPPPSARSAPRPISTPTPQETAIDDVGGHGHQQPANQFGT